MSVKTATLGNSRLVAIAGGLIVNLIWASSFVFVKLGLETMGPLTIAGLRYFLGFLILLPLLVNKRGASRPIARGMWVRLFVIGVCSYTIGNGALFWAMKYIPATTASFLLSLLPLLVLFAAAAWLKEIPRRQQVLGVFLALLGSSLFFSPGLQPGQFQGIPLVALGLLGFLIFSILGREVARDRQVDTLSLTAIPLAFGGGTLLLLAIPLEGWPTSWAAWFIVLWLALVNTAFAYLIYYRSLQVLTALEMNVLLNIGPFGTALFAWFLLGETLTVTQLVGMAVVVAGVIFVQAYAERK